jgi:hypothetical protein
MSGIGVEEDQSGDSARVIGSVDPRERSSDGVTDEEESGVGRKLLEDGFKVFGNLDEVVAEWSDVCGVRVSSKAVELGISIVGEESESASILTSALITVYFFAGYSLRTSKDDRQSLITGCQVI